MTQQGEEDGYYWKIVRRAIASLDAASEAGAPPVPLEQIAAEMNFSAAHFQRLFSRWAGISPMRYQQYLRLGHARRLLEERFTALGTADAVGLSGSGRLHDLFVTWEAMSPGAAARRGAGLTLRTGWAEGPFGRMLGTASPRGLCGLAFTEEIGDETALAQMRARWPEARYSHDDAGVGALVAAALGGHGGARLHVIGAPFQIKVWEALMAIPSGHVSTYGEIAGAIGSPRAVRAVGTAVGRNPVGYLIPCHRALRASGALGGYHWGLPVKRAMLAHESALTSL
ncbi:methylated-DNA--[protein]-cysteine S-methyltransferase [Profundibacterium mesophilum]|uniref:methylated-DNA--[protein]-cysteine S-methyltransferase n=1 Tax=Profundibacterium mesophilum KAUST100406-0324 TaxID=1037889 RepID=A0A921NUL5_9RHOB|nr:bifunctional helix-turn-helix domain-containing protein/methylated-DNA--[protein]-cysteine S-methyltransferase [Profundibacterium mesophilum]KAF0675858.1 6-O-methylguanine-DNA methyltransferase [Profundibacterium mesophilum KAUST100406-0324]